MIVLHRKGERARIELLQFTPDGRGLLTASYDGVHLWKNVPQSDARPLLTDSRYVRRARFTPDGRYLLTDQDLLTVTDLTANTSRKVELPVAWITCFFDLVPSGHHLLVAQNYRDRSGAWVECQWVADRNPKVTAWSRALSGRVRGPLACVAGDRFVLTEWDPNLKAGVYRYRTCSVATGDTLAAVEGPEIDWSPSAVSPDGRLLAGLCTARVTVFSVEDFSEPATTLRNDGRKHFTGVAFHPSGKYLAATSNDATVKLYDTTTWEVARTFTWDIGRMRSVAFSPDGTLAAAGSDKGQVVVGDVDL